MRDKVNILSDGIQCIYFPTPETLGLQLHLSEHLISVMEDVGCTCQAVDSWQLRRLIHREIGFPLRPPFTHLKGSKKKIKNHIFGDDETKGGRGKRDRFIAKLPFFYFFFFPRDVLTAICSNYSWSGWPPHWGSNRNNYLLKDTKIFTETNKKLIIFSLSGILSSFLNLEKGKFLPSEGAIRKVKWTII